MRKLILALPVLAAFALAACGSDSDAEMAEDGISADGISAELAAAETPRPGQYRTTQELLEFTLPGLSGDMESMVRSAFAEGAADENTYCLTADEAENSRTEMLSNMAESDCSVSRFDMSGGAIDAAMTCPTGDGISGDVTMTGTMSGDGADMVMNFGAEVPTMGTAAIRMRVVSERIGECS